MEWIKNIYTKYKLKPLDKDVPLFTLDSHVTLAKVVDVYDGDTCKVVFKFNGVYQKFTIRMDGYDCPEMKPKKDLVNRDTEIAAAKAAKDFFIKQLERTDYIIWLQCKKFDKYGRLLGDISWKKNGDTINALMIKAGHGYIYHGGTKKRKFDVV